MPETLPHLVSTIIPAYNRPMMLKEAVESVLAQTYRPIEIIISDDGSVDDTPAMGKALAAQYPDMIRYVWNPNRGAGPARESGRQLARGEFIQHLDSDDRLLPQKFDIQVRALREHPECGAAYGFIRLCPEDGPPQAEPYKLSGQSVLTLFPRILIDRWWNTDCPLFRRTVCDQVGPWTDLRYSQDWEYDGRVGALRTRLIHCPEFVCEQRHHAGNRQTGHGRWLAPAQQARFFGLMFGHALQAGVGLDTPEMRHFARWAFSHARQCGAMGDGEAAQQCFEIAVKAAASPGKDMLLYRKLSLLFGWRPMGLVSTVIGRAFKRTPGPQTIKQSWMR